MARLSPSLLSARARRVRRRMAAEHGLSLVEVMVSAVVLIFISFGVLGAVDNASGVSGVARAKGVATNLAEQDQERLRTFKAKQLSNMDESATRTVDGISYTIRSEAVWVSDTTGEESCTSGSSSTDYLRISSTVTWPTGPRPVNVNSIFAPPNGSFGPTQGSAAVEVLDRDLKGIQGIDVDLVGPPSFSDSTNGVGCAFFGFIPVGNSYRAKIDVPGYVDLDGNQSIDRQVSVPPEAIATLSVRYDKAAQLVTSFDTKVGAAAPVPTTTPNFTLSHAGLTSPRRILPVPGSATSVTTTSLFPFITPYAVYAGDCPAAEPASGFAQTALLTPGSSGTVTARLPNLGIKVVRGAATFPTTSFPVKLTHRGAGCSSPPKTTLTTDGAGVINRPMPYGSYDICVENGAKRVRVTNRTNAVPGGSQYVVDLANEVTATC